DPQHVRRRRDQLRRPREAGSAQFVVTAGAGTTTPSGAPPPPAPPGSSFPPGWGDSTVGGEVSFSHDASAGAATFLVYGSTGTFRGGDTFANVVFHDSATAAGATFTSYGGTLAGCDGGNVQFYDQSTAANGVFF